MKNKLTDLNNYLFNQLDYLSDREIKGEELREEIERSKALTGVAREIVSNASLALKAQIAMNENQTGGQMPEMLESK